MEFCEKRWCAVGYMEFIGFGYFWVGLRSADGKFLPPLKPIIGRVPGDEGTLIEVFALGLRC